MSTRSYMSIGDVLALLRQEFPDVTISKIRFLESQGLVDPERTPSGYRKFYDGDVDRLRWVLRQQREHFLPLKVIKGRLEAGGPGNRSSAGGVVGPGANGAASGAVAPADGAEADIAFGDVGLTAARAEARRASGDPGERSAAGAFLPGFEGDLFSGALAARQGAHGAGGEVGGAYGGGGAQGAHGAGGEVGGAYGAGGAQGAHGAGGEVGGAYGAGGAQGAHGAGGVAAVTGGEVLGVDHSSGRQLGTVPPVGASLPVADNGRRAEVSLQAGAPSAAGSDAALVVPAGASGEWDAALTSATPAAGLPRAGQSMAGDDSLGVTLAELSAASGLDAAAVGELTSYGFLKGRAVGGVVYYDDDAVAIAQIAAGFARFGVEARHLRLHKLAADREAGFIEQIVLPMVKQRNPEARRRASATAAELGRLGQAMRAALLRRNLDDLVG